ALAGRRCGHRRDRIRRGHAHAARLRGRARAHAPAVAAAARPRADRLRRAARARTLARARGEATRPEPLRLLPAVLVLLVGLDALAGLAQQRLALVRVLARRAHGLARHALAGHVHREVGIVAVQPGLAIDVREAAAIGAASRQALPRQRRNRGLTRITV